MTRLKVKIDNQNDIEAVINFLKKNGIKYQTEAEDENTSLLHEESVAYQKPDLLEDEDDFIYTDEIKRELDEDEELYQRGELNCISSEESEKRITELLDKLRTKNAI